MPLLTTQSWRTVGSGPVISGKIVIIGLLLHLLAGSIRFPGMIAGWAFKELVESRS
ncbi:MAG: hypothetical protein IT368_18160 [Candidatus Hydrogenedentes bacterium]|nr:hypothetical protein [Candidatus Hydrogenedentota bacterium]